MGTTQQRRLTLVTAAPETRQRDAAWIMDVGAIVLGALATVAVVWVIVAAVLSLVMS